VMGLSPPTTKAGRLQRAALERYRERPADGLVLTSVRFLFCELERPHSVRDGARVSAGSVPVRSASAMTSYSLSPRPSSSTSVRAPSPEPARCAMYTFPTAPSAAYSSMAQ